MKKSVIFVLTIVLSISYASAQRTGSSDYYVLEGEMTYSALSGILKVGGVKIPKGMESDYFDDSELGKFNSAKKVMSLGGIMIGAAVGYPLGYSVGGGSVTKETKTVCSIIGVTGLLVAIAGGAAAQKAVAAYNTRKGISNDPMYLSFVARPDGVGLVFEF
ncbi:MAG: hypothetical protein J5869_00050 [Bacteroidaceae bacterium]|nr:hypothetical protein [Bacteroidaceae bacterium]